MKSFTPAFFALLALLTLVDAGPIQIVSEVARREPAPIDSAIDLLDTRQLQVDDELFVRDLDFDLSSRDALDESKGVKARGCCGSKPVQPAPSNPGRKAQYNTGNPRPETPQGEFRQHTAGRHDDYFG
jgi:hypothetical protein